MIYDLRFKIKNKKNYPFINHESYILNHAFTLIELLVVISIIGILVGLSIFGLQGARKASRDAVRKADLEQIRSALGMYKADCNKYPTVLNLSSSTVIKGDATCAGGVTNTYMAATPVDPITPNASYLYAGAGGITYEICASLEQGGTTVTCGGSSTCGSKTCNYKVTSP